MDKEFVISKWNGHDIYINTNRRQPWMDIKHAIIDMLGLPNEEFEIMKESIPCKCVTNRSLDVNTIADFERYYKTYEISNM